MITGGIGGANACESGKWFESNTDLKTALIKANYNLDDFIFLQKHAFPKYFKEQTKAGMEQIFGKKFLPDEAVVFNDTLYIIEKKNQTGDGSVDEKIQSGPYKLYMYKECAEKLGLKGAKYIYLLSDFFNTSKFSLHQFPWLESFGIEIYFNKLPLEKVFK